ncbi:hypothetical protein N836_23115 [Leptolyngbya sp. Heron Island J]|nr:hypothetical protein N836_23115 [Leptolyngbya sp. Heron Island J]
MFIVLVVCPTALLCAWAAGGFCEGIAAELYTNVSFWHRLTTAGAIPVQTILPDMTQQRMIATEAIPHRVFSDGDGSVGNFRYLKR